MIEVPENEHEIDAYRAYWEPLCSEVLDHRALPVALGRPRGLVLKPCLKVLDEMFFYSNGDATICCWDVHGRGIIGDARTHIVMEIWDSAQFDAVRAILNDGRRDLLQLCSRCDAYENHDFSEYEVNPPRAVPVARPRPTLGPRPPARRSE